MKLFKGMEKHNVLNRIPFKLIGLFLFFTVGIIIIGYYFYIFNVKQERQKVFDRLNEITEMKVNQINEWRNEKIRNGSSIFLTPIMVQYIKEYLVTSGKSAKSSLFISTLKKISISYPEFRDIFFIDFRNNTSVFSVKQDSIPGKSALNLIDSAKANNKIYLSDFHRKSESEPVHIDLAVPVFSSENGNSYFGTFFVRLDPYFSLYNTIQSWPTPSVSAEVLVVRKEGDDIVYLNELRHRKNMVLSFRLSIHNEYLPAAMAARGIEGIVEGLDYRGVHVIATIKRIKDSPWFLIAKIDSEEIIQSMVAMLRNISILAAGLILIAALGIGLLWRQQRVVYYKKLYQKEFEQKVIARQYEYLTRYANDIILLMNENEEIVDINEKAIAEYQYSREEFLNLSHKILEQRIQDEDKNHDINLKGDKIYETYHKRKDGSIFPVEVSSRIIQIEEKKLIQEIIRNIGERKTIEKKLREANDYLENLLRYANSPIIVWDSNLKITRFNHASEKLTGLKSEKIIGGNIAMVFQMENVEDSLSLIKSAMRGERWESMLIPVKTTLGKERIILWNSSNIYASDGNTPVSTIAQGYDITEQRKYESELTETSNKYFNIFEHSPISIWQEDFSGLKKEIDRIMAEFPDLRMYIKEHPAILIKWASLIKIISINKATRDLYEITDSADLDKGLSRYFIYDSYEVFREEILALAAGATRFEGSLWIRTATGKLKYLDITVSLSPDFIESWSNVLISLVDMTDRKFAEDALRKSEKLSNDLFTGMLNGFSLHEIICNESGDPVDYKFLKVNPAFETLTGLKTDEIIGKTAREVMPTIEQYWIEIYGKVGITGKSVHFEQYSEPLKKYFQVSAFSPVRMQCAVIFADVTERKQNEIDLHESNRRLEEALSELQETQKQIFQQERLRTLGQMASGIAHDINNSLSPILGYSDLLVDEESLSPNIKKWANSIRTSSMDIKRTIERMKEFYRQKLEDDEFIPIKLNTVLISSIDLTKHRWKNISESEGIVIEVKKDLCSETTLIKGNESELREAITNLIINAADALPKGGTITLKTYLLENRVFCEVIDDGIGMDETTRLRCLDPFYSTKGDKGTGLGLSMVYGIMQRHDGEIVMESTVGKGTIVRLIFPSLSPIESTGKTEVEALPIPHLKILCIDDDEKVRDLLSVIFKKHKHNIQIAESGQAGIDLFDASIKQNLPYDVIITDLGMPYMDGHSVAKVIKKASPNTPIILLTGWGAFIDRSGMKDIDFILKKPLTVKDLFGALRTVLHIE